MVRSLETAFETVGCPLCGHDECELRLTVPDRFHLEGDEQFRIVTCAHCGFIYLNPRPAAANIARYYASAEYQPFLSTQTKRSLWDRLYGLVRIFTIHRKRRLIEKLKPRGRLLDVGCGTGEFLQEMKSHGWQVDGMEKDPAAAAFAAKTYGLAVETGALAECNFPDGSFDIVTLWHVLEHIHDPQKFLATVKILLREDGVLLVAVPNIGSLDAGFYGRNWVALDAPRHVSHFNYQSMRALCGETGFRLTGARQMVPDAFYNCLLSEQIILKRKSTGIGFSAPFYLLRAMAIASASVCRAWHVWPGGGRLGSSILYIIRKADK